MKSGEQFTDTQFPGNKYCLIDDWNDTSEEIASIKDEWAKIQWHRAAKVEGLGENYKLFDDTETSKDIGPNDIEQGGLGDCYFLSSLSVLAENPFRIKRLFYNGCSNEHGLFAVSITKNGHKQMVIVDDNIPCKDLRPAFSTSGDDEIWVIILEKAWAKLHGTYQRIDGGHTYQTLRDLTGAPSFEFDIKKELNEENGLRNDLMIKLCEKIKTYDQSNFVMCASIDGDGESKDKKLGLVSGHAYGLIAH